MAFITASVIYTTSFLPSGKPTVSNFKYAGDISPLNYFDPLKINSETNFNENRVKYWREAELQHGRTAMLAAVALPFLELKNHDMLSIKYLSDMDNLMQSPFWLSVFLYECVRMSTGWENPFVENGKLFSLKKNYQPGNLFSYKADDVSEVLYNNELSHGRLAMLTCAHIITSELLTGKGIF